MPKTTQPKIWTEAFPPVPELVPEMVGFWGEGGEPNVWADRRNWLLAQTADMRLHRLFAVACATRSLPIYEAKHLRDSRAREAIGSAELFADGKIAKEDLSRSQLAACDAADAADAAVVDAVDAAAAHAVCAAYYATHAADAVADARLDQSRLLALLMPRGEWLGEWSTSTAHAIAHGIYWDRAWDLMPILADAVEDAGCDNEFALRVLRELPSNVCFRGLWVVDMCLGMR